MNYRFKHHPPTSDEAIDSHQKLREACDELFDWILAVVPEGREQSLAVTNLEQAGFWGHAGIARGQ